jgi:hypothetical protein|tara:strand:- start:1942 stop:2052 length:111 start_codon:yes stop_codon:yes gene_type:complete
MKKLEKSIGKKLTKTQKNHVIGGTPPLEKKRTTKKI